MKECQTCGGSFPNGCICEAKGKMPIWVEVEILVPKKWLESLLALALEAEKEELNNTKIRIKTTCLIGFASTAKSILNTQSK